MSKNLCAELLRQRAHCFANMNVNVSKHVPSHSIHTRAVLVYQHYMCKGHTLLKQQTIFPCTCVSTGTFCYEGYAEDHATVQSEWTSAQYIVYMAASIHHLQPNVVLFPYMLLIREGTTFSEAHELAIVLLDKWPLQKEKALRV